MSTTRVVSVRVVCRASLLRLQEHNQGAPLFPLFIRAYGPLPRVSSTL
jgi:hypothetical protein